MMDESQIALGHGGLIPMPFDEALETKPSQNSAWLFLVVVCSFGYLYTSLFSFAGTPMFRTGDEDFFWTYACRLLSGQVFLRDFHQFTPPGTDLAYAAVFHLFGASVSSINWTVLFLGVVLGVVCFHNARVIMRANMAALAAVLCVVLLFGDRMDATHHWFSSMANMLAILVLLTGRSYLRIVVAGCLVGLAAFCTQTAGAMGLFACCIGLCWERWIGQISPRLLWSRLGALLAATAGFWLLLSWRFIAEAGLSNYWYAQVLYLPKDADFPSGFLVPPFHLPTYPRGWIGLGDHIVVYVFILLICPWVAALCWRRRPDTSRNSVALVLLASLGILQTLEIITMLNWNRMAAVAMPSVILFAWLISRRHSASRPIAVGCWCVVCAIVLVQAGATQFHHYARVKLPTGSALFQNDEAEEAEWLVQHTRPGDCFFEVANTRLYVPLGLRNPTTVDVLSNKDSTLPRWVDESIAGLEACQVQYILWEPRTGIGTVAQRKQALTDHLDPMRAYIQEDFKRTQVFANGSEIWMRMKRDN
jgi:hypothetical protein